jgi:hypothetical protein
MGLNTPVLVYNDALDAIAQDDTLGPRLAQAIRAAALPSFPGAPVSADLPVGAHHPGILIGEPVHSSERRLIMFGNNWQLPFTRKSVERLAARDQLGLLDQAIQDAERELEAIKALRASIARRRTENS